MLFYFFFFFLRINEAIRNLGKIGFIKMKICRSTLLLEKYSEYVLYKEQYELYFIKASVSDV